MRRRWKSTCDQINTLYNIQQLPKATYVHTYISYYQKNIATNYILRHHREILFFYKCGHLVYFILIHICLPVLLKQFWVGEVLFDYFSNETNPWLEKLCTSFLFYFAFAKETKSAVSYLSRSIVLSPFTDFKRKE